MARPNYNFEKRQRELAKKKKKEEKLAKRLSKREIPGDGDDPRDPFGDPVDDDDDDDDEPGEGEDEDSDDKD